MSFWILIVIKLTDAYQLELGGGDGGGGSSWLPLILQNALRDCDPSIRTQVMSFRICVFWEDLDICVV